VDGLNRLNEKIRLLQSTNPYYRISKKYSNDNYGWKLRHGYKGINLNDLLSDKFYNDDVIVCWGLAKSYKEFMRYYYKMPIYRVYYLYTLERAMSFEEPPPLKD
jgi:hypothetical protein